MSNFLRDKWTFWYDKPDPEMCVENWDQFLIRMGTFQKLEDLWGLLNNISSLTILPTGSNFHLFKKGIEPKWEDFQNQDGGKWILELPKLEFSKLEKIWKKSILLVVGTELNKKESELINGIVISARKEHHRISIWTKYSSYKELQLSIGEKWKKIIQEEGFTNSLSLEYLSHKMIPLKNYKETKDKSEF
mmetsp:Transcript_26714/g.63122  ORF Transcript_26714/g.63122 Transcript_26714/m.63122 type:complete len:190 (-) Transcript_26714:1724-2293(-)